MQRPTLATEVTADAKAGKGGKAAKPAKNNAAAPTSDVESSTDDVEIGCELEAWHVDVLVRVRVMVGILDQHCTLCDTPCHIYTINVS